MSDPKQLIKSVMEGEDPSSVFEEATATEAEDTTSDPEAAAQATEEVDDTAAAMESLAKDLEKAAKTLKDFASYVRRKSGESWEDYHKRLAEVIANAAEEVAGLEQRAEDVQTAYDYFTDMHNELGKAL